MRVVLLGQSRFLRLYKLGPTDLYHPFRTVVFMSLQSLCRKVHDLPYELLGYYAVSVSAYCL